MDASPGAFKAFEAAMGIGRFQNAAPTEMLVIAKIAALREQDCGPCMLLALKMAREAGVPEEVIRGALHGRGLTAEQRDIYDYARGVAADEELDPELLPRLNQRWGREVVAELALGIASTRLYPTMKRALGFAKSCALVPELAA
jgi:alkylhydroperoxidase family enzyme